MKQQAMALFAGLAIALVACACGNRREEKVVTEVLDSANRWFQTNALTGQASCEIMFVHGAPQLDVVGLTSTKQQEAFVAMLSSKPTQLHCVRFWKEKPTLPFYVVMIPEASFEPPEKRQAEMNAKLLRTVQIDECHLESAPRELTQ